ncbi:MAG: hypothetical protein IPJ61_18910 [Tessaracoccus sp.]|uniref:DUF6557 family protein n=1 Tax=Tessaracoccus sp. TaxID=1971211 RepID=UPI001EBD45F2|nr:DUF6557 family protein [Tessaracoccus sp.]MBK7823057.1 hypothetical protein [Tessaracoccus sp.]
MNLHELLATTPPAEVLGAVFAYHADGITDDTRHGYAAALTELRGLTPASECPGTLDMEPLGDRHPYDVWLIQPDGTTVSASLMPWTTWLAVDVPAAVRAKYADAAILGAVLWELTFHGFSAADVDARAESIITAAAEAARAAQAGDRVVVTDIHKWLAAIRTTDEPDAE